MRYVKNNAITNDPWVRLEGDAPVPFDIAVIVSADRLAELGEDAIKGRSAPLGVIWPNDRPVSQLTPYLPLLALVCLEFPVFRDGRAYTQARQLREDYGFKGELRASGDVLRDQLLLMLRCGFDAFEVRKAADAENFAEAARAYSASYQFGLDLSGPIFLKRLQAKVQLKADE